MEYRRTIEATPPPATHPFSPDEQAFFESIPSRLELRHALIARALDCLRRAGCAIDPLADRLCLDEAIINACLHGNHLDPRRLVTVRAFVRGPLRPGRRRDSLEWGFEIGDEGSGFAWREWLTTTRGDWTLSGSTGRGLRLMQAFGARLHFPVEDGSRIVVVRHAE